MKVLVIGYYDKGNLGDDAYQEIMGNFFPDHTLSFVPSDKLFTKKVEDYEGVIVGGGDIINDYFNRKISPFLKAFSGPKIAFSIGIPFPSLLTDEYLAHFDHVFTRNFEDVRSIQKLLGSHRGHFTPDIGLSYTPTIQHKYYRPGVSESNIVVKTCGVFLVGNLIKYPKIVEDLGRLIAKMALTYNVVMYTFNPREDTPLCEKVRELAMTRLNKSFSDTAHLQELLVSAKETSRITVDSKSYGALEMIHNMMNLNFAICMRYHSHIFCTVAGTPYMSISSVRKTRSFMAQTGLVQYQYPIPLDGYENPMDTNYEEIRDTCNRAIRDRITIAESLRVFLKKSLLLLESRQASQLISLHGTDIRNSVNKFISTTGDYENGARLLSNAVVGYPDTPYIWGMKEKFENAGTSLEDVIRDSATFMMRDQAVTKMVFRKDFEQIPGGESPIYVDLREYQSYNGAHRGGWYMACEEFSKLGTRNSHGAPNGIILDMYMDRTFHWARSYLKHQGIVPYTVPWCGFIHHTENTSYTEYSAAHLFEIKEFQQSLTTCLAIFVLSEILAKYLRGRLASVASHIKVIVFSHPVETTPIMFSLKNYVENKNPQLINIGAWMRNPFTIYLLGNLPIQRAALIGKDMEEYTPPENLSVAYGGVYENSRNSTVSENYDNWSDRNVDKTPCRCRKGKIPRWIRYLIEWLETQKVKVLGYRKNILYIANKDRVEEISALIANIIKRVVLIRHLPNKAYDEMLARNVVFLDLVDAAAVNTIIECIIRRTPIIVNKIPGTVALLGEEYPLFYTDISTVPSLLEMSKIKDTYRYLSKMDTKKFHIYNFIASIRVTVEKLTT